MKKSSHHPDDAEKSQKHARKMQRIAQFLAFPIGTIVASVGLWRAFPQPQIPVAFQNTPVQNSLQATHLHPLSATSHHSHSARTQKQLGSGPGPLPTQGNQGQNADTSTANHPHPATVSRTPLHTMVSLGDSITHGYGLPGSTPSKPSPDAYPALVAKQEQWSVKDLGVTGWSSSDLLNALSTTKFKQALNQADLVTIDIGSNDLLHASYNLLSPNAILPPKNAVTNSAVLTQALAGYTQRLPKVIAAVKAQTDAPIVLINLYDPFPDGSSLHDVAEQLIGAANQILWETAAEDGIPVVDAHALFNHHQATDVRLNSIDIHPTLQGQRQLATLVESAIAQPLQYEPNLFAVSPTGTLVYSQPTPGPFAIGWLHGSGGMRVVGSSGSGKTGEQLKILMPNGQPGYIAEKNAKVLVRPFPQVSFNTTRTTVGSGQLLAMDTSARTDAFSYQDNVYVPLQWFGQVTGGTVNIDDPNRTASLATPMHSGLVQSGWDEVPTQQPAPASAQGQTQTSKQNNEGWHYVPSKSGKEMTLTEGGWLLEVDGEPVDLTLPMLKVNGQLYAPAAALWTYLGGRVRHDTNGLLKLSLDGS